MSDIWKYRNPRKRKVPKRVRRYISRRIRAERKKGKPMKQSIAIAFSKARAKYPKVKGIRR